MITIKLPYTTMDKEFIMDLQKQSSNIIRYAYNRFYDGYTEKDIRNMVKSLNNVNLLDSWFIQCSIRKANKLFKKDSSCEEGKQIIKNGRLQKKQKHIHTVFGGKHNFNQYSKGKISKEQYKQNRLLPICSQGEAVKCGNRKLEIQDNKLIIKYKRNRKIELILPKLRKNYRRILSKLRQVMLNKESAISFELTHEYIYLIYEENLLEQGVTPSKNRVAAIDLNPNYIGFSVCEFYENNVKEIYSQVYDLSKYTQKLGIASNNKRQKHQVNKQKFELIEVSKRLVNIARHYQCEKFVVEDLNIKPQDHDKGKNTNRLCNNKWNRNIVIRQINKRCKICGIEFVEVNPTYSSFIGNILHNKPDMIASSMEIGRRGYYKFVKGKFYPELCKNEELPNGWKEEEGLIYKSWKELFNKVKTLKLKYRRSLDDFSFEVYSLNSPKSGINILDRFISNICFYRFG